MARETIPINKLYKTLFFIALIVGPIYWLMFTPDGTRRTDSIVLWLAGDTPIDLNFKILDDRFRVKDWKLVYPDVEWQCSETRSSALGEFFCYGEIATYNGIPSRYISVFFIDGVTSAVKLVYRDQYHSEIGRDLTEQLGKATLSAGAGEREQVLQWHTGTGVVLLSVELARGEEGTLMWLPGN